MHCYGATAKEVGISECMRYMAACTCSMFAEILRDNREVQLQEIFYSFDVFILPSPGFILDASFHL